MKKTRQKGKKKDRAGKIALPLMTRVHNQK